MMEIPTGPSVDVSPAGLEGDVRVKVECLRRRSSQVTAQPEQVSDRILEQTRHWQVNRQKQEPDADKQDVCPTNIVKRAQAASITRKNAR